VAKQKHNKLKKEFEETSDALTALNAELNNVKA
jgi:hypothetical protein